GRRAGRDRRARGHPHRVRPLARRAHPHRGQAPDVTPAERVALGIDVGGTTFTTVLVHADGRVMAAREDAMPLGLPPASVIKTVAASARAVAAASGLEPRAL